MLERIGISLLVVYGVLAMVCFSFKDRPLRFGLGLGVVFAAFALCVQAEQGRPLYVARNFFGVKRVTLDADAGLRRFYHGTTSHGAQSIRPARAAEPLAYYHRSGPVGDVFTALGGAEKNPRVAIIGLGVGAMACYAAPGQHFTFYEIDPLVERIARDERLFTFLRSSRGTCDVVLGDGRLTLARAPDRHFGIIVLDAFSSDAIPTHLLSREALALYLTKLEDDGVLMFHVSNHYLNLEPLLANWAAETGTVCLARSDLHLSPEEKALGKLASQYVVMARRRSDLGPLADNPRWRPAAVDPAVDVWTDQYCSLISLLRTTQPVSLGPAEAVASP